MTEEDWLLAGVHQDKQYKSSILNTFGDYLVERGWVLLHNPQQGIAIVTKNPVRQLTKAQKEFLYDYYITRGCKEEANNIFRLD